MKPLIVLIFSFIPYLLFSQNEDIELIAMKTEIVIKKNKLHRTETIKYKINAVDGRKFSDYAFTYKKTNDFKLNWFYIKDKNGNVVNEIDEKDLEERSMSLESTFYSDYLVKEISINHTFFPYYVEYKYTVVEDEFFIISSWKPFHHDEILTKRAELIVRIPADYNIKYNFLKIDSFIADTSDDIHQYTWIVNNVKSCDDELFSPSTKTLFPFVEVYPENFFYEKEGSFKSWESFGFWKSSLYQGKSLLTVREKNKIHEIIHGDESELEMVKKLYHHLQDNFRYINISLETGGLSPHSAGYVCHNKYGDCKALTNYFKSVLEEFNIESYCAMLHAGSKVQKVNMDFPNQFSNHIILYVPLDEDTLWLDCTSKGPFGYVGSFIQGREVFVLDGHNSSFSKTKSLNEEDVECNSKKEFSYNMGYSNAKINYTYRGIEFERLNYVMRDYSTNDKEDYISETILLDGYNLNSYDVEIKDRDSLAISVFVDASSRNHYKSLGNELLIKIPEPEYLNFENPGERKLPVLLSYPIHNNDSSYYEIPSGYKTSFLPERKSIFNKYGTFTMHSEELSGKILIVMEYSLFSGSIPLSEYEDFYNFQLSVINSCKKQYIILEMK